MPTPRGNALIGQSGGPTAVINQSLVGLIETCLTEDRIGNVYGARRGIRGVLDEDFWDLGRESRRTLEGVARTPCAALQSVRQKPTIEDTERALEVFAAHDIRYFFYIGGNDSAEAAALLNQAAVDKGYDMRLFHVPKTIDNDLEVTDHCPGYGSAARFVAEAFMGDNEDNRSLPGIKIDIVMGRHAGWLTGASLLARQFEDDGPHLVYVPEVDFDMETFLADVQRVQERFGRCLVAVSEGIHDKDGRLIAKPKEADTFGNVQLSGSGALGDRLANAIRKEFPGARVRADTFGYLQRSHFGVVSPVDASEARAVGCAAVRFATHDEAHHGTVVIRREGETPEDYRASYGVAALEDVARHEKVIPAEYLDGKNGLTGAFLDYVRPLVGSLPLATRLEGHKVPKRLGSAVRPG